MLSAIHQEALFFYLEHLWVIDLLSLIFDENINPQPHRHRKETYGYQREVVGGRRTLN